MQLHGSLLAVLGYALLCGEVSVPVRSEHVTTVPGYTLVVGDSVEIMSAWRDCPTWLMLVMAVRFAWKLPKTLVLPTEVWKSTVYVGMESQVKAALAQFREPPCVTVQVKVTSTPGHAAVLPSCSTVDTTVTSATVIEHIHLWIVPYVQ